MWWMKTGWGMVLLYDETWFYAPRVEVVVEVVVVEGRSLYCGSTRNINNIYK